MTAYFGGTMHQKLGFILLALGAMFGLCACTQTVWETGSELAACVSDADCMPGLGCVRVMDWSSQENPRATLYQCRRHCEYEGQFKCAVTPQSYDSPRIEWCGRTPDAAGQQTDFCFDDYLVCKQRSYAACNLNPACYGLINAKGARVCAYRYGAPFASSTNPPL